MRRRRGRRDADEECNGCGNVRMNSRGFDEERFIRYVELFFLVFLVLWQGSILGVLTGATLIYLAWFLATDDARL